MVIVRSNDFTNTVTPKRKLLTIKLFTTTLTGMEMQWGIKEKKKQNQNSNFYLRLRYSFETTFYPVYKNLFIFPIPIHKAKQPRPQVNTIIQCYD